MKILVATDGSEYSLSAIDVCCDLVIAGTVEAVKVISVYEAQIPIAAEPFVLSSDFYQKLNDIARDRTQEAVQEAVEMIRSKSRGASLQITTGVELGQPAPVIAETAREWDADLIIVGSHGRGFWGRLALGSVSDAVVHRAPCSVMVVRAKQQPRSYAFKADGGS